MKKTIRLITATVLMILLTAASGVSTTLSDFPCNPDPKMIIACRNAGGTFHIGT